MIRIFNKNMIKRNYWTKDLPSIVVNNYEYSNNLTIILNHQTRLLELIEKQNNEQLRYLKKINESLITSLNSKSVKN